MASYAIDPRCLDWDWVAFMSCTKIEFAHEFIAIQIPEVYAAVERCREEGGESAAGCECDGGGFVAE